jgi:hypothetical protein
MQSKVKVMVNLQPIIMGMKRNKTTRFPNQNKNKSKPNPKSKSQNKNQKKNKNTTNVGHEFNNILLQKWNKNRIMLWPKEKPKLMLNKLKVVGDYTFIYTPWTPNLKKFSKKLPIYMWPMFTQVHQCAPMCELWMN